MKNYLAALALTSLVSPAFADGLNPRTVTSFDLERYMGRWYEVESTHHMRQSDCACTTTTYSLNSDESVRLINTCRRGSPDGVLARAEGNAVASLTNPAALSVNLGGFPFFFPNYFVAMIDEDYSYAVVSAPLKSDLWILSRERTLDSETLTKIRSELKNRGYDVGRLRPTLQIGCRDEQD
jgi:apolipoprotein D and lipocalin family protein